MTETPFRIGGVYRNRGGTIVELQQPPKMWGWCPDEAMAVKVTDRTGYGSRNLSDGICSADSDTCFHLLPGELHQINGEWVPRGVPVEDKPAKSSAILRAKLYDDGRKLASDPSAIRDREHIHVAAKAPDFDPWKGFFTEPADMADWQDTYYPR
jgi:hypothetical protein